MPNVPAVSPWILTGGRNPLTIPSQKFLKNVGKHDDPVDDRFLQSDNFRDGVSWRYPSITPDYGTLVVVYAPGVNGHGRGKLLNVAQLLSPIYYSATHAPWGDRTDWELLFPIRPIAICPDIPQWINLLPIKRKTGMVLTDNEFLQLVDVLR